VVDLKVVTYQELVAVGTSLAALALSLLLFGALARRQAHRVAQRTGARLAFTRIARSIGPRTAAESEAAQ
jgi:hypothetical protein